jgi:uncharacterized protein YcbK (DUF882 family)
MKYFTIAEFDSPEEPGSGVNMHQDLLELLDEMRTIYGKPIAITSGYRTKKYNASLKNSKPNSSHLKGLAVDIASPNIMPPALQMDHLITILLGMLGLGGLRTYEKLKDKSK